MSLWSFNIQFGGDAVKKRSTYPEIKMILGSIAHNLLSQINDIFLMPKTEGRFLRKRLCWDMGEARLKISFERMQKWKPYESTY